MKELDKEVPGMLNSMSKLSRKLALSNLYDRDYNITPYILDLINGSGENLRKNGFMKTSNPHKDVIVYELNRTRKFVFKEEKDKKYVIANLIQQSI